MVGCVNICLKLSMCLKALLIQHPYCAGFVTPPPLHGGSGRWPELCQDMCFLTRLKARGALPPKSRAASWVQVVPRVPVSYRGWERVEAESWLLTLPFLQSLWSPATLGALSSTKSWYLTGAVSCDEFASVLLLIPTGKFSTIVSMH